MTDRDALAERVYAFFATHALDSQIRGSLGMAIDIADMYRQPSGLREQSTSIVNTKNMSNS